jgi:hypothetical protein
MHDAVQPADIDVRLSQDALDAGDDRPAGVAWCRQLLAEKYQLPMIVDENEVREGATDVHTNANTFHRHHWFCPSRRNP